MRLEANRPMNIKSAVLAACACGALVAGCDEAGVKPPATPVPEVVVEQPTTKVVTDYEDFTGYTDAVYTVEIRARVTGYLDKVLFKDGDEVPEGKLLFEIDPRPYQAEFDRAQSSVTQAEAHLARLENDHRRAVALESRNAIGREEYDKIVGDYNEAVAAVGTAKAVRDTAKLNLEFTKVTAPIAGQISERRVVAGNLVKADDTLLTTIVSVDPMYFYFDIDETTLLKLRKLLREGSMTSYREPGTERYVNLELANEEGFPRRGKINFADNRVTQNTGTLRVRGEISNPKSTNANKREGARTLSPGMFVRVRLPIGEPHEAIEVPERAVGTDQGNKYLFVLNTKKQEVEKRNVEVGMLDDERRVITKGLGKDEVFVVEGLQRIRNGSKVRLKEGLPRTSQARASASTSAGAAATTPAAAAARTPSGGEARPPDAPAGTAGSRAKRVSKND